jgi:hypothetical protein
MLTEFHTPYLFVGNSADAQKIRDIKEKFKKRAISDWLDKNPGWEPSATSNDASALDNVARHRAAIQADAKFKSEPKTLISSALQKKTQQISTVSSVVTLTPNGNVPLGFNCREYFTAVNNFNADVCYWEIKFLVPATNSYQNVQFMGGSYNIQTTSHSIKFPLDYSVYGASAYANANGTASFVILCQGYNVVAGNAGVSLLPGEFATSDPVVLNFNVPQCIGIANAVCVPDVVRGGINGTEPTLTVNLDGPAPPGGQQVNLSVGDNNLGNIMGSGNFVIPPGATQGSLSWFLGTRKVHSTGKVQEVKVNLQSTNGPGQNISIPVQIWKQK